MTWKVIGCITFFLATAGLSCLAWSCGFMWQIGKLWQWAQGKLGSMTCPDFLGIKGKFLLLLLLKNVLVLIQEYVWLWRLVIRWNREPEIFRLCEIFSNGYCVGEQQKQLRCQKIRENRLRRDVRLGSSFSTASGNSPDTVGAAVSPSMAALSPGSVASSSTSADVALRPAELTHVIASTVDRSVLQDLPQWCSERLSEVCCNPLLYLTFGVGRLRLLHLPSAEVVSVRPNAHPRL